MFVEGKKSSPGVRALLGRFLHGLLPHRLLQLVGAAWSYIMGPWEASSFLPSGWLVHRSVRSGDLPEVLEVLGLRPESWEELGECLEDLTPWKDLISTSDAAADLDLLKSWKSVSSNDEELAFSELNTWQKSMIISNMQLFWQPGSTCSDVAELNNENIECYNTSSASHRSVGQGLHNDIDPCKVAHEKSANRASSLGTIYMLNAGTGGVLTKVEWKEDRNLDAIVNNCGQSEFEIQHIRDKRLRFLQHNDTPEGLHTNSEKGLSKAVVPELPDHRLFSSHKQPVSDLSSDFYVSECLECQSHITDHCDLLSHVSVTQDDVLVIPEMIEKRNSCNHLPDEVQEVDKTANFQHMCQFSPDKDQGYHSLEYWQCLPLSQNVTVANCEAPKTCGLDKDSALPTVGTACPLLDKNDHQNSKDMDCDLQDEIPISRVTFCTNEHIGYILGTVVSDDRSASSCDEGDDDGFDSEGSVSTTDSEHDVDDDLVWNSFCSADPYNLQNFTASLQTGAMTGENLLSLETLDQHQSDEESWCDSNAESGSESDCADEEENQKLWNAFLKSDDPYNPLCFKACVQTSEKTSQSSEISSTYSEVVCRPLPNHKVTLVTCQAHDFQQVQVKKTHNVPVEDNASPGHKKVTFHEEVTIHYVYEAVERKGHWEELARDRCRFQRRIKEIEFIIGHCLTPDHRQKAWERMQGQWNS